MLCAPNRQEMFRQEESVGIGEVSNGNSLTAVLFLVIQGVSELKELFSYF